MPGPAGQYYLNGKDLWVLFGVAIKRNGTEDFLKYPDAKETIEHDWMDSNGLDVDLSRVFLKSKDITIPFFLAANSEDDWWKKYNAFFAEWTIPGPKRFEVTEFSRSFFVKYNSCSALTRFTRIKQTNKVFVEFTISITDIEPRLDNTHTFLVDDDDRFIIT